MWQIFGKHERIEREYEPVYAPFLLAILVNMSSATSNYHSPRRSPACVSIDISTVGRIGSAMLAARHRIPGLI